MFQGRLPQVECRLTLQVETQKQKCDSGPLILHHCWDDVLLQFDGPRKHELTDGKADPQTHLREHEPQFRHGGG